MTTSAAQSASIGFGFAMAAMAAVQAHGPALGAATLAAVTVLIGLRFRTAATVAVLLAAAALALSDAAPVLAATSGLCAAGYLVLRHSVRVAQPTLVAAVGFAFAGLAATAFAPQLPWLPVLAPVAVIGIYMLAVRPFG